MLRDGLAGLRGKNSAQIKMAAPDFLAEFLQRRRFGQVLFQQKDDLLHALLRKPLLPGAEHFRICGRLDKERQREFQRLALKPKRLRAGIDGRLAQGGDELLLAGGESNGRARNLFAWTVLHCRPHNRMQGCLGACEMFREKRAGKFHGQKTMLLVRTTPRGERFGLAMIKPRRVGREVGAPFLSFHEAFAL